MVVVLDNTLQRHNCSPAYQQERDPDRGPDDFQDHVTGHLEYWIREEEDRQGNVVLRAREIQLIAHTGHICISNIATIEEAYEVQES